MAGRLRSISKAIQRKKVFEPEELEEGNLRRCLTRWDLTALGLGSTLGVGVYVLIGSVALNVAGPSIVLSFLIAAISSLLAGLCYAEFGSRVPRAGSAYIYTYVTVGELAAFIIGWNIIFEALFGSASVAKGLSLYVDTLSNKSMSSWLTTVVPIEVNYMSQYFDLFSFCVVLMFGLVLAFGVRESSLLSNAFALLNLVVIVFVIVVGGVKADSSNWFIPQSEVPPNYGDGGFFPYGLWGMFKGAAICFYGFVGFDVISSTGEEVHEPRRAIPCSIITVLAIVFVVYACVSTVVTMMVPYYLMDTAAAVATAFSYVGWDWARWIVTVGATVGMLASLFGAMFPLPRLLYAMASDGLFFHWFAKVSTTRKSPIIATIVPTCFIAVLSAILELEQLILIMCVGTLLSYTIVAVCVLLLRYRSKDLKDVSCFKQVFDCRDRKPTQTTSLIVEIAISLFTCTAVASGLVFLHVEEPLIPAIILHAFLVILILLILVQPKKDEDLPFKTPLVPIIPCLSIYVNVHLLVFVNIQTWIRVGIWVALGVPIYIICVCCYKGKLRGNLEGNLKHDTFNEQNGKSPVNIVVEPSHKVTVLSQCKDNDTESNELDANTVTNNNQDSPEKDEIIVSKSNLENNDDREAKIIDLLDQVLQAEEDTYGEVVSIKDNNENILLVSTAPEVLEYLPHRKSFSEISDAGSEASLGPQVLSKYDVIAQVHREDMPKLNEEEEQNYYENTENKYDNRNLTILDNEDTHSRTDESGYSDTIDRNIEDVEENIDQPVIPPPPPLDEAYFATVPAKKFFTVSTRKSSDSLSAGQSKPRESLKSNNSLDDGHNIVFGSDRQMSFMTKLNTIFLTKMTTEQDEEKNEGNEFKRQRSHSTGSADGNKYIMNIERPPVFLDLKKELLSRNRRSLRQVESSNKQSDKSSEAINTDDDEDEDEDRDTSLSKEDLKNKLEVIYATGGPRLMKPKRVNSNPPTPEESIVSDLSSSENLPKPKEKNDTLKRQKDRFGDVLNSLRLSLKDDPV